MYRYWKDKKVTLENSQAASENIKYSYYLTQQRLSCVSKRNENTPPHKKLVHEGSQQHYSS